MQLPTAMHDDEDPFSNHPPPLSPLHPARSDIFMPAAVGHSTVPTMEKQQHSTSIFVEHLEDAIPSHEDMEVRCMLHPAYVPPAFSADFRMPTRIT